MRIAAKRLRYVLELTEFCFGDAAKAARRSARDLQDLLGEIHDCDVMLPRVRGQAARLREADAEAVRVLAGDAEDLDPALPAQAPNRDAYRGLDLLAVHFRARRELLFRRFAGLWAELEHEGTWRRLEHAVDAAMERAAERRRVVERAREAARSIAQRRGRAG